LHDHIPDSSYQFPASDYQRGPEAAGVHTTQDIADMPASLLKDCVEVFAPAITTLANLSLQT